MRPYLRVKNIYADRIDLSDVMEMDFPAEHYEKYKLEPGDILLCEGQSPEFVGRPAMYRGELPEVCFTNSLIRFRPHDGIDRAYALYCFLHLMYSGRFQKEARITTNIAHLSASRLSNVEFPLAPSHEQARIVEAVEEYTSRIEAARRACEVAATRLGDLRVAMLSQLWEDSAYRTKVSDITEVVSGPAFKSSTFLDAGEIRLLRGDNIEPGALRWSRTKYWPTDEVAEYRHLLVEAGDLILGMDRPVISTGLKLARVGLADLPALLVQRVARIRVAASTNADYLYHVLQHPRFADHLLRGQTGTQLPHVTLESIRAFELPLPERAVQDEIVARIESHIDIASRVANELERAQSMAEILQKRLLASAFAGELVPQDPADESASQLLERIRSEKRAKKGRSKKVSS